MRLNNAVRPEDHKTILMLENLIANLRAGNIETDQRIGIAHKSEDTFLVAVEFKGNPHINISKLSKESRHEPR